MKWLHVLVVEQLDQKAEELLRTVAATGLRCGVLRQMPLPPCSELEQLAIDGVTRVAAIDTRGSLLLKPRRALPSLRNLLREQFLGCDVVLLACAADSELLESTSAWDGVVRVVRLQAEADGWRLITAAASDDGARHGISLGDKELASRLRRPYLVPRPESLGR